jgi:hypothetical protein
VSEPAQQKWNRMKLGDRIDLVYGKAVDTLDWHLLYKRERREIERLLAEKEKL